MKLKKMIFVLLVFVLASCAPAAVLVPIQDPVLVQTPISTNFPTANSTPIPPAPTITPTPAPENLADAKDLPIWIDDYVHAYGGKVMVNNMEMDGSQLTDEIRKDVESFTQIKEVKGFKYSFLVINGVPLALMGDDGKWNEATLKNISNLTDISFGIGAEPTTDPKYHLYYNFTQKDRNLRFKQSSLAAPADMFQTGEILHKGERLYDWSRPDNLLTRFEEEGLQVRASPIIWANDAHPDWLIELSKKGMQNPEAYKDDFTQIMRNYMKAVVLRYKGKFKDWMLLNELLDIQGKLDQNNFWVRIIGPEIAKIAILDARSVDPDISIIINDYPMLWNDSKTNGMVSFISQLKKDDLLTPRDAVGIQAHDSIANPKWNNLVFAKNEIKDTLRKFAKIGIHARITELDLFDVMKDDNATKQKKADIYKTIVEACFEINSEFNYPVVDNITTWGIKNDESWQYFVKGKNFGYPLYFDKEFDPEPTYFEMLKVFYENTTK